MINIIGGGCAGLSLARFSSVLTKYNFNLFVGLKKDNNKDKLHNPEPYNIIRGKGDKEYMPPSITPVYTEKEVEYSILEDKYVLLGLGCAALIIVIIVIYKIFYKENITKKILETYG